MAAGLVCGAAGSRESDLFLISRRPHGKHLAGSWEFPGGKIEGGEAPAASLVRELREELGVEVEVGEIYAVGHHVYDEKEVVLLVYACRVIGGEPQCHEVAEFRWVSPTELVSVPLPPADAPVIERLRRELAR